MWLYGETFAIIFLTGSPFISIFSPKSGPLADEIGMITFS